jgi:hypothetical protein
MIDLDMLSDLQLIQMLERRGYVVRDAREARHPLSWNRTAPFPEGVDFKAEAVEKIREAIMQEHIQFRVDQAVPPAFPDDPGRPEIHRAVLRVL